MAAFYPTDAQAKADRIVSESEVMQRAISQSNQLLDETNAQAQELIDNATQDSNTIRINAINYTDEILENLEKIMNQTLDATGQKYNNFVNAMQSWLDIVKKNRSELAPSTGSTGYTPAPQDEPEPEEDDEE